MVPRLAIHRWLAPAVPRFANRRSPRRATSVARLPLDLLALKPSALIDHALRLALRTLDRPGLNDPNARGHADICFDQMFGLALKLGQLLSLQLPPGVGRVSTTTSSSSSRSGRRSSSM